MKTWLKGGVIACGAVIVLSVIFFLIGIGREAEEMMHLWLLLGPGTVINQILLYNYQTTFMSFLLSLPFYFGLGSLIGWLVGRLKKKEEVK